MDTPKLGPVLVDRKLDLLFHDGNYKYGCCICGRDDGDMDELFEGGFRIVKELKDMIFDLYVCSKVSLRELAVAGFLLFGKSYYFYSVSCYQYTKLPLIEKDFKMILCDAPAGYVCRVNQTRFLPLPYSVEMLRITLLPILKCLYETKMLMQKSYEAFHHRNCIVDIQFSSLDPIISRSFFSEESLN